VPYRGGGPALTDVIGGQINFFFSNASASTGHVRSGALRAVAHSGTGRLGTLPDVPAVAETLPGFEAYEWNGAFVPRGTPAEVVQRLNAAMNDAIAHPPVAERLAGLNVGTRRNTPEQFRAFLEGELTKWERVIREGNIRITRPTSSDRTAPSPWTAARGPRRRGPRNAAHAPPGSRCGRARWWRGWRRC